MTLTVLMVVYFACGVAVSIYTHRNAPPPRWRAALSALVMVAIWPLWAPFVCLP
jgi:hypothetical protein